MKKIFCRSYPKVVMKKGNFHGKSRLFPWGFSQGIQWARRVSQGPEELSLNTWITFLKIISYLIRYKSLSLHEVNKPNTESLWIERSRRVIKLARSPCYIVKSVLVYRVRAFTLFPEIPWRVANCRENILVLKRFKCTRVCILTCYLQIYSNT